MRPAARSPPPARARRLSGAARPLFVAAEALPWLAAMSAFFIFPNQMILGGQTLIMILFALSLDLILGYAGIVTLGHAAYFRRRRLYGASLLITDLGWNEPISGLACARVSSRRIAGFLSGWLLLRYRGLALLGADAVDDHHAAAAGQLVPRLHRRL